MVGRRGCNDHRQRLALRSHSPRPCEGDRRTLCLNRLGRGPIARPMRSGSGAAARDRYSGAKRGVSRLAARAIARLTEPGLWLPSSAQMVNFLKAVNRRPNILHSRLELKREVQRIVPRLVQIAAMEP